MMAQMRWLAPSRWNHPQWILAASFAVLCLLTLWMWSIPQIGDGTYRFAGGEEKSAAMPLNVPTEESTVEVRFSVMLGLVHPVFFLLTPDDCLEALTINGARIDVPPSLCLNAPNHLLNLSSYLHAGRNEVSAIVRDHGGTAGLRLSVHPLDPLLLATLVLFFATLIAVCAIFLRRIHATEHQPLMLIFIAGTLLRIIYTLATHYLVRGHDTDAHMQYIRYMATHFRIPPAIEGWEYFQPPLYYALSGLWFRLGAIIGRGEELLFLDIQKGSLLLSIGTLGVGIWVGTLLLPDKKDRALRHVFAGILAAFPTLIYLSARLNNDTLLQLLAFLFFAFLWKWWMHGQNRDWYLASLFIGLGMLTKNSAILWVPVMLGSLAFRRASPWWNKGMLLLQFLLITMSLAGWLYMVRLHERNLSASVIGNVAGTNGGLLVPVNIEHFLTFNPIRMLEIPYAHPWDDATRRAFLWEYFFRSAFSGEFGFTFSQKIKGFHTLILAIALLMLPVMFWGMLKELKEHPLRTIPLLLLTGALLGSHVLLRATVAFTPLQDFRYSYLLIVPLTYFACKGAHAFRYPFDSMTRMLLLEFSALCAIFILGVVLIP